MLNYSIVMRSINSNLLNINQAKSRINAAKAALLKALGFTVGEAPDINHSALSLGTMQSLGGCWRDENPKGGDMIPYPHPAGVTHEMGKGTTSCPVR